MLRATGGLAIGLALSFSASAQTGFAKLATAQTSVGATAVQIVPARPRQRVILTVNSAVACAFGSAGVTISTGFLLQAVAGATLTLDTSAAIYAVCASTASISDAETQ